MSDPNDIVHAFFPNKNAEMISTLGNGHINDTFLVRFADLPGDLMVLQRVNHLVFPDVPGMMANIRRVTEHQQRKLAAVQAEDFERRALRLIPTAEGLDLLVDEDGNYWRAFQFIPGVRSIDVVEMPLQVYEAAKAFGEFQALMADLEGPLLDTIPNFHHTPSRFEALEASFAQDLKCRAKTLSCEMDYARSRKDLAYAVVGLLEQGQLPLRVTHNDTKINNVLFDVETGKGICVIDLDTVMSGALLYDFGDLVRTASSLADEDERDLSKVKVEMLLFSELARGFMESAAAFVSEKELELMPLSGALISYELGMRFLKDYLDGDLYFKVAYPEHNRVRARAQFKRAEELLKHEKEMTRVLRAFQ